MRVVLAPDSFTGTLTAAQATEALAAGWREARPYDELVLQPMSDGGPGFLDALPGTRVTVLAEDPLARPVLAAFVLDGTTAYVESAQAAGLHLLDPGERDSTLTTTYGVGQLVVAAVGAGATRVVVGLGGSATNDGGGGFLAALGLGREGPDGAGLPPGGLALARTARLVGEPLRVELVAATDVDSPLTGPYGASRVFGPQKGAGAEQVEALEAALGHWADVVEAHLGVHVRDAPGAGAAGGLGFAMLALGASRVPGFDVVAEAVGLGRSISGADLVITGEGRLDGSSTRGKVVSGVARLARQQGIPCVAVAGEVRIGRREAAAAGLTETWSLVDHAPRRALDHAAVVMSEVAERVARGWDVAQ